MKVTETQEAFNLITKRMSGATTVVQLLLYFQAPASCTGTGSSPSCSTSIQLPAYGLMEQWKKAIVLGTVYPHGRLEEAPGSDCSAPALPAVLGSEPVVGRSFLLLPFVDLPFQCK